MGIDQAEIHRKVGSLKVEDRKWAAKVLGINFAFLADKKQAWDDLIWLSQEESVVGRYAVEALGVAVPHIPDKEQTWNDLIRLSKDINWDVQESAMEALVVVFPHVPDKEQAWNDLHRLTQVEDWFLVSNAEKALVAVFPHAPDKEQAWNDIHRLVEGDARALGFVFPHVPDKEQAWNDLHRLAQVKNNNLRGFVPFALVEAFPHVPDKEQAWNDLHRLTQVKNGNLRGNAAHALGFVFSHVPDKEQAWNDLHRLTEDTDSYVRWNAAKALVAVFPHIPNKEQAWNDLIRLSKDKDIAIGMMIAEFLGAAFPHVPDKDRAWNDLHRLTQDVDSYVRWTAAEALVAVFPHIPNKEQVWYDLIQLTQDKNGDVRWNATEALGAAFPHVPDKDRAWNDMTRLAEDKNKNVRGYANYSLGRASIFKATEAETEDEFGKEIETAIAFFEKSLEEAALNPAIFCLPFYRSFYTITFKKHTPESEVQKYLAEAKRATEGSENKEKLLEAIENLANALKEVQDARKMDFDIMKRDLNACRRYCDRAAEILDTTGEQAPGATGLIRKGLPIIDQRIKEILGEIKESATVVCRAAKGTPLEALGREINQIGNNLLLVRDPIGLEKQVAVMEMTISSIGNKMSEDEREEACKLLKRAKVEPHAEVKLPWFNAILSKIPAQLGRSTKEQGKKAKKRKNSKDEQQAKNEIPYSSELESEISDLFKSFYQKYREESDSQSKTLAFLKTKLHDLNAAKSPFTWLDVGCGYGRALDVIDAVTLPRDMFEYHGIDAMHKYLDDTEKQAKKHKLVHWQIEKMDAAQMHFNLEFDIISAVLLLHEIDPLCLPYVVKNMVRALKPEGTLVISDFQGPYEQEEGIVAWSAEDIKQVLESICGEAKASFEPIPAGKYPKELGFYACYVKKSDIDNAKFERFMENYKEFLEQKKTESKELRNELRRQIKERVTDILGRSDIDTKNISPEDMEKIKGAIKTEYGIKAHKIRLLSTQIEFLDDKIAEFNSGTRCAGAD